MNDGNGFQRVLIIAGCNLPLTPVVRAYMDYLTDAGISFDVVEYADRRRLKFFVDSLALLLSRRVFEKTIFVNNQSLPLLFLAALLQKRSLIYWKLESYGAFVNWSLALKLQLFEWIIPRSKIPLILPNSQRLEIQHPEFPENFVLPNAPFLPYVNSMVPAQPHAQMNFLIYGNIDGHDSIYVKDWTRFFERAGSGHLSVYGATGPSSEFVSYHGRVTHQSLLDAMLSGSFGYSLVGYRNLNENYRLAAPNKLIESLSCGVPVIGNVRNPFVAQIVRDYECGICMDFDNIDEKDLGVSQTDYERHRLNALSAAKALCLANQVIYTPLAIR